MTITLTVEVDKIEQDGDPGILAQKLCGCLLEIDAVKAADWDYDDDK